MLIGSGIGIWAFGREGITQVAVPGNRSPLLKGEVRDDFLWRHISARSCRMGGSFSD